ncbi:hypothetical protein SALBM217S_05169 [Streptomyces griseoloalbus]
MSVPYGTAACEPPDSSGSPEEHLARLLGRALNSFELPDESVRRLDCALAHDSSLHSAHHGGGLHRETYRHTWLLADGSALTLWELAHNTAPGGEPQHEVYVDEEELRTATARLPLPSEAPEFELPVTAVAFPLPAVRQTYASDDSPDHARRLLRRAETRTGRAPRRRPCCRRRARTASPRRSAARRGRVVRRCASRCTSTRSCWVTAGRSRCGRSSTR